MLENQHSRYGAITRMLPPTLGKVFFVVHTDNTSLIHLLEEFPTDRDGVPRVYATVSGAATDNLAIQAALDAAVAGRNDYVIVLPGNGNDYDLGAKLTMSKNDVHLVSLAAIANNGSNPSVGASRQVVLEQTASDDLVYMTGQNCEFAGFYCKPKSAFGTVEGGSAAHGAHVHHNTIYMIGTSVPIDFHTIGGAIYIVIEYNYLTSQTGTQSKCIGVHSGCTGAIVRGNYIIVGDGATATKGIYNAGYKGITEYNTVAAVDGAGADGTVTVAFEIAGGVCNRNIANTVNTADFTVDGSYMDSDNCVGAINKLA